MIDKLDTLKELNAIYIEDDLKVRERIYNTLIEFFNRVEVSASVKNADILYKKMKPDVIFVDIELIDGNGLEWINYLRSFDTTTSIIVITSSSSLDDLLKAIPLRLEDYIIKPITFDKLKNVFMKIVDSKSKIVDNKFYFSKNIVYNFTNQSIYKNDVNIQLSKKEALLLELLIKNIEHLISYEIIDSELYSQKPLSKGTIRNYIQKLRNIIGKEYIESIVDRGYKLILLKKYH